MVEAIIFFKNLISADSFSVFVTKLENFITVTPNPVKSHNVELLEGGVYADFTTNYSR